MRQIRESGFICVKDELGIEHAICELTYFCNEDEAFKYVFKPNYSVISLLKPNIFFGIPGLNLDLRKEEYVRENRIPCFISERVPQENREDLYDLLAEVGLDFIDPIEYLIRTKKRYSGDKLYMIRSFKHENIVLEDVISTQNNSGIMRLILDNLAHGNNVKIGEIIINNTNRKAVFETLKYLYKKSIEYQKSQQKEGIKKAISNGSFKGRKPIEVDIEMYVEYLNDIENKTKTVKEVCELMGISRDKFYRVKKTIK